MAERDRAVASDTSAADPRRGEAHRRFRSRRVAPPTAEGRWSLLRPSSASPTEAAAARAQQLLARYGVLTREVAGSEGIIGGFSAVYDVLKALEDAGRIRRGYFASGVGATQFALPAALDLLRSLKEMPDEAEIVVLAATDPANPYGTILHWPDAAVGEDRGRTPTRSAGSLVVMVNGALAAYISRGARQLTAFPLDDGTRAGEDAGPVPAARAGDQRSSGCRASAGAVSGRGRVQPVGHGIPDSAGRIRARGVAITASCPRATPSIARRQRCTGRSPAIRSCASSRCSRR
jgi:ATP-dependent Lhr-like helicase